MTSGRRALCTFSGAYDNYGPGVAVCGTTGSSCSSCTWTHGGTTYAIPAEREAWCTDKGLCLDGSGNPKTNIGDSASCASASGTCSDSQYTTSGQCTTNSGTWTAAANGWVGGAVFTVVSANATATASPNLAVDSSICFLPFLVC